MIAPEFTHWKVDRRVPVAVILALLVQMGGALIWATQLDARVGDIERVATGTSSLNEKFARLEERLKDMKDNIDGMRRQLDQLTDRVLKK
ncbi:MAG: hypothetical protein KGJ06_04505 [Pseudomonadota bacterium]|nr:hypothetical protein [Pseudomonadota bacterium]